VPAGFTEFHYGIPWADWLRTLMNWINPDLFMTCGLLGNRQLVGSRQMANRQPTTPPAWLLKVSSKTGR
jgi:hypothetical protein